MTHVVEVDPARPEGLRAVVADAVAALRGGGLVVMPTETVYGLAASPEVPGAAARIFEAKRRPASLSLPVLVATAEEAWTVGRPTEAGRRLAAALWPGPVTLVLDRAERAVGWDLGEEPATVGVRVPDHPVASAVLAEAGPLAVTSANISGSPPLDDVPSLLDVFRTHVEVVLALPAGASSGGVPSTVVDVSGPEPRILRQGAVAAGRLQELLR